MKWTIKSIRTNLNLNQQQMAEKLGISRETYQNYETYKTFPDVPIIKKIIELSKIDFNDIVFLPSEYAKSEEEQEQNDN